MPSITAAAVAVAATSDWYAYWPFFVAFLCCVLVANFVSYRLLLRRGEMPAINGVLDVISPFALCLWLPEMFYPALLLSLASAMLGALVFGYRRPLAGVAIATAIGTAIVAVSDLPGGATALLIYVITSVRAVSGIRVISARERRVAEQMRDVASHDPLTGLANRMLLNEALERSFGDDGRSPERVSLLVLDLNDFKRINDVLGHHYGDDLLIEFARRLTDAGGDDAFVARTGGDEFTVLIPDEDGTAGRQAQERIRAAVADPLEVTGIPIDVRVSIGAAHCPTDGTSIDEVSRHADIDMYSAKALTTRPYGRRSSDLLGVRDKAALASELSEAIREGTLDLNFSPRVDLGSGEVDNMAVSLQWEHPLNGPVDPDEFLDLARLTGDLDKLARWMTSTALAHLATWQGRGHDSGIYLDLARLYPLNPGFSSFFEHEVTRHGLRHSDITVSLDASVFEQRDGRGLDLFGKLAASGVRISVDSMVTAHTALVAMEQLPLHEMRLAVEYTSPNGGHAAASVAESVVESAHVLGLEVVATGLADPSMAGFASGLRCERGQGSFFSAPTPSRTLRFGHFDPTAWRPDDESSIPDSGAGFGRLPDQSSQTSS